MNDTISLGRFPGSPTSEMSALLRAHEDSTNVSSLGDQTHAAMQCRSVLLTTPVGTI
jgi:hypothetical protein